KSVSGKELCKAVERKGWKLRRISGSHHIYAREGIRAILSIPVHGNQTLVSGLQANLMKAAGLTEKDL
ncbi:MAG TPA: type II toxin-antitoxin system HicA family toxin, partial [Fimbriimonadaceae bacterium]|nr:type II toxin-antitoxin system HicA family toxin [Fimbriimonadaceae bacterium]